MEDVGKVKMKDVKEETMSRLPRCIRASYNCSYIPPEEKCDSDHLEANIPVTTSTRDKKISKEVSMQKNNVVANTNTSHEINYV